MTDDLMDELRLETQAYKELEVIRRGLESVRDVNELRSLALQIATHQVRRYYLQRKLSESLIATQSEMLKGTPKNAPQAPRRSPLDVIAGWLGGLG